MTDTQKLKFIRAIHTAIYLVMAVSTFVLVCGGVTGYSGLWFWVVLVLLLIESVAFAGNGLRCPLTGLAVKYGAESGRVFDTLLPERCTRYTFRFFGTVMVVGLVLLMLRWLDVVR